MENAGTILIGIIVLCAVAFAVYAIYKNRKNGKGCGNGCANCSCAAKRNGINGKND